MVILENAQENMHKIRRVNNDFFEKDMLKKLKNKVAEIRRNGKNGSGYVAKRKQFATQK